MQEEAKQTNGIEKDLHYSSILFYRSFPKYHLLHFSWASQIAQLVKNLPAMQETLVQFLGGGDLLEKG